MTLKIYSQILSFLCRPLFHLPPRRYSIQESDDAQLFTYRTIVKEESSGGEKGYSYGGGRSQTGKRRREDQTKLLQPLSPTFWAGEEEDGGYR